MLKKSTATVKTQSGNLSPGKVQKGGVNAAPTTRKPPLPPGQLVIPSAKALAAQSGGIAAPTLLTITALARRQYQCEREIMALQQKMVDKAAELQRLREVDIPGAFEEAGTTTLTLSGGVKIEVKPFIVANIKDVNEKAAFTWLRKNKFGSLIKNNVTCAFGMGEDKIAKATIAALKKMKVDFMSKESVHNSTLRAFVKEQMEKGAPIPKEIDHSSIKRSVITLPKEIT